MERAVRSSSAHLRMADVAARAGVSIATVSRALSGAPGVSERTRLRVRAIADDLSYVISPEASSLAAGSTGRVAVLAHDLVAWYGSSVLHGVERELRTAGLDVLLYCLETSEDRRRFFDQLPLRRKADAVVNIAMPLSDHEAERLRSAGLCTVMAGVTDARFPSVSVDDEHVAALGVNHLVQLGHRRIAFCSSRGMDQELWPAHLDRLRGYQRALQAAGLPLDEQLVAVAPYPVGVRNAAAETGRQAMDLLLSRAAPFTAVLAYSDEVAAGALQSLRRAHRSVPERVSVVGIDDHPTAGLLDMTTVRQDPDALGREAARLVLAGLGDSTIPEPSPALLEATFVIRGSTAPPPDRPTA